MTAKPLNIHEPGPASLENIEAEAVVLGAMLNDNSFAEACADRLLPDDFSEPVHTRIFETIVQLCGQGQSATPVTLRSYFVDDPDIAELGGVGYLARLTGDQATLLTQRDNVELLRELSQRRRILDGLQSASASCSDLAMSIGEVVGKADSVLSSFDEESRDEFQAADCIEQMLASYGEASSGVTCGAVPSIDRLIGPAKPKQMIVVAGRPGMGKTAAGLSYALGAARRGHGTLFVSLEMSAEELGARMASEWIFDDDAIEVPFHAIRDGTLTGDQRRAVSGAASTLEGLPLHIKDASALKVGQLRRLVRRYKRRMVADGKKLELVVVDYLQLLRPDREHRSRYEVVSEISRSIKAIAKENDVAIMALAQLSRAVEQRPEKRPILADLRDSGDIEQDADTVLFLCRQQYYHEQSEPDRNSADWEEWNRQLNAMWGEIEFICAKRRNGRTGALTGKFYGDFQAVRG